MLGVNYWPAAQAMDWLRAYDPAITRRDFASAAAAGFDTIRVFLRWEDAQPTPTTDRPGRHQPARRRRGRSRGGRRPPARHALHRPHERRQLDSRAGPWAERRATAAFGSSAGGRPCLRETGLRNWYGDPAVVDAQERLATATADALAGHPGIWGWDLGNENSNCTIPPDATSGRSVARTDVHRAQAERSREADHDRPPHGGPRERPCDRAGRGGALVRHRLDARLPDLRRLGGGLDRPRAGAVPRRDHPLAGIRRPGALRGVRPTDLAGAPADGSSSTRPPSPRTRAASSTGFARSVARARSSGASATTPPSSHAVPPFDAAPHELSFGLWRADGTAKAAVSEVTSRAGAACVPPRSPGGWLDIDAATFAADRRYHLRRLYDRFRS